MIPSRTILFLFLVMIAGAIAPDAASAQNRIPEYAAYDIDGGSVSLQDHKGEIVLLNVWATWCEPCRRELPYLQSLHETYSIYGLRVIGTSVDAAGSGDIVKNFATATGMTYDIWLDPSDRATYAFRMIGVPETILIDADGGILHQWKGPIEAGMGVEDTLENALGVAAPSPDQNQLAESAAFQIGSIIPEGQTESLSWAIVFSAGLLSFLSPCVLPLVPAYATFITGTGIRRASEYETSHSTTSRPAPSIKVQSRFVILTRGLLFILGFSIVFVSLGAVVSHVSFTLDAATWIERIGGVIVIIFGLHLLGLLRLKWLYRQRSLNMAGRTAGNAGVILTGMGFGAGWTPCIGPILAAVLTLAATGQGAITGAALLAVYSAGLAVPFILSALAMDNFIKFLGRARRWMGWIERASGILLIGIGALLLTGSFSTILAGLASSPLPEP